MSQRDETIWSKKWISHFKKQCSNAGIFTKAIKIHGHPMQERGVSDYIICYEGRYIAIEFKTNEKTLDDYQSNFLEEIYVSGGMAMAIWVHKEYYIVELRTTAAIVTSQPQDYGNEKRMIDKFLKIT